MRRYLLKGVPHPDGTYAAEGEDFHYLAHVLRLAEGAELPAGDEAGRRYRLILEKREKARLVFRVRPEAEQERRPPEPEVVLLLCLPKPAAMDLVVRMASEIGVSRLAPLTSERSAVPEKQARALAGRRERWEKIARAAFQQSGRPDLLAIEPIRPFASIEACAPEKEAGLFADSSGRDARALHEILAPPVGRVRCLVGPEGGLAEVERASLVAKGFAPVSLGESILRTETAAATLCAAVKLILAEKASWTTK